MRDRNRDHREKRNNIDNCANIIQYRATLYIYMRYNLNKSA